LFVDRPVGLVSDGGFGVGTTPVGTALRRDMAFAADIVVVGSTAGLALCTALEDSELQWSVAVVEFEVVVGIVVVGSTAGAGLALGTDLEDLELQWSVAVFEIVVEDGTA
jgi:hypothetical protein